jgi:hypothetical protein
MKLELNSKIGLHYHHYSIELHAEIKELEYQAELYTILTCLKHLQTSNEYDIDHYFLGILVQPTGSEKLRH